MNRVAFLIVFITALPAVHAGQADTNPLSKAVELLDSLSAKVTAEMDAADKAYKDYEAWCGEETSNLRYQITTGESKKEELEASISKAAADTTAAEEKIESLAGSISSDEQERKEATSVRAKEAADFATSEADLVDALSTLDRALAVVQKEMSKNPASLAQVDRSNINNLVNSLGTVIDAATFPATDQKKLLALAQAQAQQKEAAEDEEFGAPSSSVYKTQSGSIFDMLEDLKERAEGQLADLRKAESGSKANFLMLDKSLADQIGADTKDMNDEKSAKATLQETKSIAEGDLVETTNGLANDKSTLATLKTTCQVDAADHEASQKARKEELAALATAKQILAETSVGAGSRTYSFLQVDHQSQVGTRLHSRQDLANAEIVTLLKKVAKENHSTVLAQLASRVAATLRYSSSTGQDPFSKVRQLITDMLAKLQAQAEADATEKGYCDSELAKSGTKKSELDAQLRKLSAKIDQAAADSAQLKSEVKETQAALAKLARSQAEMDSIRMETHQEYEQAKADLQLGLEGVRKVISVLKDYYGASGASASSMLQAGGEMSGFMHQPAAPETHVKSGEAGGEILNELEIVESDFAQDLATEEATEADAQSEYEKMTQVNKNSKVIKEQDVKYKTREAKGLDKTVADVSGDKENANSELDAVLQYTEKLKQRCVAKAESYETRRARREAELEGLKEALSILESETAFVQHPKKRGLHAAFLSAM